MGQHLGTASYDLTWRLWDVNTGDCLLEQVRHKWFTSSTAETTVSLTTGS